MTDENIKISGLAWFGRAITKQSEMAFDEAARYGLWFLETATRMSGLSKCSVILPDGAWLVYEAAT